MHFTKKNLMIIPFFSILFLTTILKGSDFITINDPIADLYGTVSGMPLIIDGTSSQPNMNVRLFVNTTEIGYTPTDISGNWNFSLPNLGDGTYTMTATLINSSSNALAVDTVSFMVDNPDTIIITSPAEGDSVSYDPIIISGAASLPSATVNILLDGTLVTTTTTDINGNWSASYILTAANGTHTFLAQLLSGGSPIASASVDIVSLIPLIFPAGKTQVRVVAGGIPASGSGSGAGYTYSVSGSIATINFIPAFTSIPSVTATGMRSSGSSTVTVTSISTTAASIAFSTGTQNINFTAAVFS